MTIEEIQAVLDAIGKIDIVAMDWIDQLAYMAAVGELAEKIRPLVVKYANELPRNETFLLKLGSQKFPQK